MVTTKPIEKISHATPELLTEALMQLKREKKIYFWCFIQHKGETLEDGWQEDDHVHVYLEPGRPVETREIESALQKIETVTCKASDPHNEYCEEASWGHWFLYALHDTDYMQSIGIQPNHRYSKDDMQTSDDDELFWRAVETTRDKKRLCRKIRTIRL